MRVLVACEESQAVCKAFRELGHEAYSCDIIDQSGGHPEWHIMQDVLPEKNGIYIVDDRAFNSPWIHTAGFEVSSQAWCENHGVYYDDKYGRYEDGRVTAWQPLPEPWEGEDS